MLVGKVASIVDRLHLVIDKGANDGVRLGQRWLIYEEGDEIHDPGDYKTVLGRLELPKAWVRVVNVQAKISTVVSDSWVDDPTPMSIAIAMQTAKRKRAELPVDEHVPKAKKPVTAHIRSGDLVRLVEED